VGVEKLPRTKLAKIKIAQGCPTNDFLSFLGIMYPQILAVWEETGLFQPPLPISSLTLTREVA